MTAQRYDVAIVGYGPIGQVLATLLGRRGLRVAVFDKQASLYPLPRACHLDHEAMRILQAAGIAAEIESAIVPAREYLLLRPDLSVLSDLPRGWDTPTGWESSYHFYQPDIEGIFDDTAKATPGVSVFQGRAVTGLAERDGEVVLTVDGIAEPVHASFVVGADGANSFVRGALGIPQEDLGFEATWVVVDVEIAPGHAEPKVPDTGQVLDPIQPRHMAWLGGRHYRWEFMIVDDADPAVAARPENVWPKLSRWVDPESAVLLRSTSYTFRSLVSDTFNRGRVLLAGDAAHLMPPFMGQGMVSGMRDAATLSWMLDVVLRGAAPLSWLDGYTATRRPHVTAYIAESVRVGRMVCETDPVKAAERDRMLESQTEAAPPFQPPLGAGFLPGPLAGRLAVQPRVLAPDERLLDDVLGSRFGVLTIDPADLDGLADAQDVMTAFDIAPAVILPASGSGADLLAVPSWPECGSGFADWLRAADATWVLVRPDAYVYDSGTGAAALDAALTSLRDAAFAPA